MTTPAPEELAPTDTYPTPEHGWVCFHCGETFPGNLAGWHRARDHFGHSPSSDVACRIKAGEERGLLRALRRAEAEVGRLSTPQSPSAPQIKIAWEMITAIEMHGDGCDACKRLMERAEAALKAPSAAAVTEEMVVRFCEKFYGPSWTFTDVEMVRMALTAALSRTPEGEQS